MVTTLKTSDTALSAEVFEVPRDYPSVETEDGSRLREGVYWWYVREDGCPDSYPSGPFGSVLEALADWDQDGAQEPQAEEEVAWRR